MTDADLIVAHFGWSPARRIRLVNEYGTTEALVAAVRSGRVDASPATRSLACRRAGELRERLQQLGVEAIGLRDLPPLLREIHDPPGVLFVRGRLPDEPGVAVVGSRKASGYGLELARACGAALAEAGVVVVSGLARGIDGAAHEAVVRCRGTGVAVLGSGIDIWYPRSHWRLGEQLLEYGGAVVSEYPPGTTPAPWRFPVRNRIISGLVEAVVVVEAAEQGGALITARLAADQGRTVLAVPGDVDRPTSAGTNRLIRDGALPVLSPADLLAVVATATTVPVAAIPTDPLLDLIGAGRRPEWLAAETGLSATQMFVRLGELEVAGAIIWRDGLVCRA